MKTTKPAVILLALVLLTAAGAQSTEKSEAEKISETYMASCLVKITTDETVLPLNNFAIEYLMSSSGVAGKAASEILDISPDIAHQLFEIEEVFGVDSFLGGYGGGDFGGGGYGIGLSGMNLPADATPGASTPGASAYGASTASRSTKRTTPTAARTTSRTPTTTTTSPSRRTTTPRTPTHPTTPYRRYPTRTSTATTSRITRTTPPRAPRIEQPSPSTTEQTVLFRLSVDFSQVSAPEPIKPAAEEFMGALIDNLRSALRGAFDQYSTKLNKQLELAYKEAARAEEQLVNMQANLRAISGSRDLSRHAILQNISSLRQILQSANMKLASDEMLYEATVKQIAEEQARRKKLVEDDPITLELQRIVEIQTNSLVRIQERVEQKTASSAEVEDVLEKLARARIELAKRREEVSNPPGSLVLSSTNEELASLSTRVALAQQEINSFEKQLKDAEERLISADDYELLSLKADIARQSLEETLLWRARLGRNNRSIQPPDVTVIGAE